MSEFEMEATEQRIAKLDNLMSDQEFDLVLRRRIRCLFAYTLAENENLSESHNRCTFTFSNNDKSEWNVAIGENYSLYNDAKGELLSATFADAIAAYNRRKSNKLSLLLPHG